MTAQGGGNWPNSDLLQRLGLQVPIALSPMLGAGGVDLAVAVSRAGGLGSLPCASLSAAQVVAQAKAFRAVTSGPLNLNFFCHADQPARPSELAAWRSALQPFYQELDTAPDSSRAAPARQPFSEAMCVAVEGLRPEVVSFHFGLPASGLLQRVKATGALVCSTATTVQEALWLEAAGCDVIIAQGLEAGGHRGTFLDVNPHTQMGVLALVPQVVDRVRLPVVAAGGIADGRALVAALALGASAVQIGTAYLLTPESMISGVYRDALKHADNVSTVLTNVFSGRLARGLNNRLIETLGPVSAIVPEFPHAADALAPLKAAAEDLARNDFTALWAGQAAASTREQGAEQLTRLWAEQALGWLRGDG